MCNNLIDNNPLRVEKSIQHNLSIIINMRPQKYVGPGALQNLKTTLHSHTHGLTNTYNT